ncbi:cell wall hydrolase [Sphingomonas sp. RB56-2]|uniref:Cell wall hydrolase n=1 Tax=Sphingomonas brevis TaxID=2908206 RepID=A0ABT0SBT5_9SPHN|nr:cell wall hydrolase [Sphingomonas brevis]MCL6741881.1 cell wall hydrolase [Sphingomonas brevis]
MTLSRNFGLGRRNFGFAVAALLGAVVGGTTLPIQPDAASATVTIAPAVAASLMAATSGQHLVENRAIGDQAKLINAAMPFSGAPVLASRPFDLSNSDPLDRRRALLCMTQAVYYEAGFESLEGRQAVAQVVINRLRHPAFPKSVCGVVYQGARDPVCQFSFVCDGSLYRRPALHAWKEAEQVAAAALDGFVDRSVGAATHYHADYVAPYWAPRLAKIVQIGAHIFYRWPGAWGSTAAFTGRYIGEPADPLSLRPPLRQAVLTDGSVVPVEDPALAGPPIPRAENDVGGLLDTTKGWTLNIPMPSESGSATKSVADHQQTKAPEPAAPVVLAAR